jgi:hypothetical protein
MPSMTPRPNVVSSLVNPRARRFRRACLWGVGIEVPLALLLALAGIPGADGSAFLPNLAVILHLPGLVVLFLLDVLGLGLRGGFLLSEMWSDAPVAHPSALGIVALAVCNGCVIVVLKWLQLTWWGRRRASDRTEGAA